MRVPLGVAKTSTNGSTMCVAIASPINGQCPPNYSPIDASDPSAGCRPRLP